MKFASLLLSLAQNFEVKPRIKKKIIHAICMHSFVYVYMP